MRALIDTGSQWSYILMKTAEEMRYQSVKSGVVIHALFGGGSSKKMEHYIYDIQLKSLTDDNTCKIQVLDQPIICGSISWGKSNSCMGELRKRGINLTDIRVRQPPIEILIGTDRAGKLYIGNIQELECRLTAVQIQLGWVVMWKMVVSSKQSTHACYYTLDSH